MVIIGCIETSSGLAIELNTQTTSESDEMDTSNPTSPRRRASNAPASHGHGFRFASSISQTSRRPSTAPSATKRVCGCRRREELGRPVVSLDSRRFVAHKRDIKQFRQACREVGLSARERRGASRALHAEKQSSGTREHISYQELVAWLREWIDSDGESRSS